MESFRIHLSIVCFLAFFTAQAQDSFYEKEPLKVRSKRLYLVAHMQGVLTPIPTHLNGSALFSESPRNLNPGYEFTLGTNYNDKLEISAGIRRVSLYTGYTFRPFSVSNEDNFMAYSTFAPYWQLPVQLKVCLWQPTRKLSVWSMVGGAVAFIEDGVEFSGSSTAKTVLYSANKTPKTLIISTTRTHPSGFIAGEIGLIGRWSVAKRIGLEVGIRRYLSKNDLFIFSTKIVDDLGREDNTTGRSGLNTFSYSAGLSIRVNR